jgi:hypothetical protein
MRIPKIPFVEILIIVAIVGVLASVLAPSLFNGGVNDGTLCRGGYKFVAGSREYVQVLDRDGKGIPCGI